MKPVIHMPRPKPKIQDSNLALSLSRRPSLLHLASPRNVITTHRPSPVQDPFLNMRQIGANSPKLRPIRPLKHMSAGTISLNSSQSQTSLCEQNQKPLSSSQITKQKRVLNRNSSACAFPPISSKQKHTFKDFEFTPKDVKLRIPMPKEDCLTKREMQSHTEKLDFRMSQRNEPSTPYFSSQTRFKSQEGFDHSDYIEEKATVNKAINDLNTIDVNSKLGSLIARETKHETRRDFKEMTFRYKKTAPNCFL